VKIGADRCALLGPGGALVLGRGDDVDVLLEGKTVSRRHVEIAWEDDARHPRFRDLGSANGTRHRGLLRAEGLLGDGDSLEVGPYRIMLEREERDPVLDTGFKSTFDDGPELQGSIEQTTLGIVLRKLAVGGRTGTFEVELENGMGLVVLAGGRVVSAEFHQTAALVRHLGKKVGLTALQHILGADKGAYRFHRTFEVDDGEPVDMSVEEVLASVPA
jgi:hypothetical protein